MLDFLIVSTRTAKHGVIEVYPKFKVRKSSDLMIRGGDFYAIWDEEIGLWSTDEEDAVYLIDKELDAYAKENKSHFEGGVRVLHMWDSESGMIDSWHKYCQKQCRDNFHMLDEKLIFSNTETCKSDYASKKLPYPLEATPIPAWDRLISVLYSPEERHKIEWAIGAIVSGDSKFIQKFMVLYGAAGTGKSTILNVIQKLFDGYYSVFDAKALGSSSNAFALEAFKSNPLVAIQHDGDLSRIEDNTRINSLVSHELMTVNEKFKTTYSNRFKCFLFMGTNKPVKITDAKSGLIRRLIDVTPSGDKLSIKEYNTVTKQVDFELGGIAHHCLDIYKENPGYYDGYIPIAMLNASNDFYNFVLDSYLTFKNDDGVTLKAAWEMYKTYCDDAKVAYPFSQRIFKEELRNYFKEYTDRYYLEDGTRVRSYFHGFLTTKFEARDAEQTDIPEPYDLGLKEQHSLFDDVLLGCKAQYANSDGTPIWPWDKVETTLSDIDTTKLHYVLIPEEMSIVTVDFDIPDENGNKCFKKNLEAAACWPKTYTELSKSGEGIHLEYIYTGDTSKLNRLYAEHIEIKVSSGKSSLRRKLTKCNDIPLATISSGLPLKGETKMVNYEAVKSEKALRSLIIRNLHKEIHPATKPSIDFIYQILEDAHNSDLRYDVSDLSDAVLAFAVNSTNQSQYCIRKVNEMHFKSEERSEYVAATDSTLVFYDIEVFPNLLLINWKFRGKEKPVIRMINPSPEEVEKLLQFNLIGFNCREYDNHIVYARAFLHYDNERIYDLSRGIIAGDRNCKFGEAYNISYTDIYDFASAGNKKSLKKLEIEMGIHHKELGMPWDQPVPEDKWHLVAEYCDNDVIATEAAFEYLKADFAAREILADITGSTVNDTTNQLSTKMILGNNREPQSQFLYRNLAEPVMTLPAGVYDFLRMACPEMMADTHGKHKSLLPYFPGYECAYGKSMYRGEDTKSGGYVYTEPGIYWNVALLDISSMHPHSIISEVLFGVKYTTVFRDLVEARVAIKHEDWDAARKMLNGNLSPYIDKVIRGELSSKDLAGALKTVINSIYGLTFTSYSNPFRDPRNKDNFVAKRGALFMIDLKHAVQERGFTVAHIKTDSIKIPDATPEIVDFVMQFGKRYGYSFEHEATYDRMCLVNKAVYIAKFATKEKCEKLYGYVPGDNAKHGGEWTPTGTQFAVPYVLKTLFTKEDITFDDLCETKSVKSALYLDMNEALPDVTKEEAEKAKLWKKITDPDRMKEAMKPECDRIEELSSIIEKGHAYQFIGKVGQFCPIKSGCGGGILLREGKNNYDGTIKYDAAPGTIGYRWLESEMVRELHKEACIDRSYYDDLVNKAVETISGYGDFEAFVADDIQDPVAPWFAEATEDCPFDVR